MVINVFPKVYYYFHQHLPFLLKNFTTHYEKTMRIVRNDYFHRDLYKGIGLPYTRARVRQLARTDLRAGTKRTPKYVRRYFIPRETVFRFPHDFPTEKKRERGKKWDDANEAPREKQRRHSSIKISRVMEDWQIKGIIGCVEGFSPLLPTGYSLQPLPLLYLPSPPSRDLPNCAKKYGFVKRRFMRSYPYFSRHNNNFVASFFRAWRWWRRAVPRQYVCR